MNFCINITFAGHSCFLLADLLYNLCVSALHLDSCRNWAFLDFGGRDAFADDTTGMIHTILF